MQSFDRCDRDPWLLRSRHGHEPLRTYGHDPVHPRTLDDAAQLGEVDGTVREPRLPRARAVVAGARGRGRVVARRLGASHQARRAAVHARRQPGPGRGRLCDARPNKSVTVDFEQDRAPLLSIAYEHDHIIPPRVVRHIVEKYAKSPAITEFKEFKGRPHFPGAPGWEEVAGYALAWATEQAAQRRTGGAARGAPIRTA